MICIDMIKIDKPVIEYLDLSGLDEYDVPEALRDPENRPILEYRYSGFCIGVNDANEFRLAVARVISSPSDVMLELKNNYSLHIPSDQDPAELAAGQILVSIGA